MTSPAYTCLPPDSAVVERWAIAVQGVVQGVGFRPFVYNTAHSRRLSGWVRNDADAVRIVIEGETERLQAFIDDLQEQAPPQARIDEMHVERSPVLFRNRLAEDSGEPFKILASVEGGAPGAMIPADLAPCDACIQELSTPGERRYRYPFTNCTNCGPRWSIIEHLPYDRKSTSMAHFAMCPDCHAEYEDPTDRRFHAQPIACDNCGPTLRLLSNANESLGKGDDALREAARLLRHGRIVAMKGIGGFQLLVDATRDDAVARLRRKKHRPDRPFAILCGSVDQVRRYCEVSEKEAETLSSAQAPILLLRRQADELGQRYRTSPPRIANGVAPENPYLGMMLPSSPLHFLLIRELDTPVVCTSGNVSQEPMVIDDKAAFEQLGQIADVFLTHDRPIVRPVDDSVARVVSGELQMLRRARGHAPGAIQLRKEHPTMLAVGAHLKNTAALSFGKRAVLTSHIGDLGGVRALEVHRQAVADLIEFHEAAPEAIVCDLHPDYASTRHAEALADEWKVPLIRVQHHHAHVAACMAEHRLDGPVLGLAWDGTGQGIDGTIWGGEALLCEEGAFTQVATLRQFGLPGGEAAIREPRRAALGTLFETFGHDVTERLHSVSPLVQNNEWFSDGEVQTLLLLLERRRHTSRTSSMGRLFDAVAAICGLRLKVRFEGQAAMALEYLADRDLNDAYTIPLRGGNPVMADWGPMLAEIWHDLTNGTSLSVVSSRFHNALADLAIAIARHVGCPCVALTGGCFQNALLTERVETGLVQAGFQVYQHRLVPPGDGGIALGQLYIAGRTIDSHQDIHPSHERETAPCV